jgi:hypothetical protein
MVGSACELIISNFTFFSLRSEILALRSLDAGRRTHYSELYLLFLVSELISLIIIPYSAIRIPQLLIQHFPDFSQQPFQGKRLLKKGQPFLQNTMMDNGIVCIA